MFRPSINPYLPSDSVDVWNFVLRDVPISIALCKDSLEIWCNDVLINPTETLDASETKMDFEMMSHKMRIMVSFNKQTKDPISVLTIDGEIIPRVPITTSSKNPHPIIENNFKVNNQNYSNK